MLVLLKVLLLYLKHTHKMGKIDLANKLKCVTLHAKAATTATATIQGTEVADFLGAMWVIDIGAWTANGLTVTLQDSNDNSTWADVAASNLYGDMTANDLAIVTGIASTVYHVGYKGSKKYIGAKITDAGSGDAVVGVYAIVGFSKDIPATN